MTLGLTTDEMKSIFKKEYIATYNRREIEQDNFAQDLIAHGLAEIEAQKQAMYHIRQEATVQALLLVIQAYNNQIEIQLKQKHLI